MGVFRERLFEWMDLVGDVIGQRAFVRVGVFRERLFEMR